MRPIGAVSDRVGERACIRIETRNKQKFELIDRCLARRPGHSFAEGSCNQMENTPSTLQKTMNSQGERRKNSSDL